MVVRMTTTLVLPSLVLALLAPVPRIEDHRVTELGRVLVGEAGWHSTTDHAAILHAMGRRADRTGEPVETMAARYSSAVKRCKRAWVCELPALPSERYRESWEAVRETARAYLRGKLPDPCPGSVHYGDRQGDMARAKRMGLRRARCSAVTANVFWRL